MLQLKVIEVSMSLWRSRLVLVPKPDRSVRFCIDFRKRNQVSESEIKYFDAYPMPRVVVLIDRIGETWVLATIYLMKGYWQILFKKGAQEKTAFTNPIRIVPLPLNAFQAPWGSYFISKNYGLGAERHS